jgi:hypothetical protein
MRLIRVRIFWLGASTKISFRNTLAEICLEILSEFRFDSEFCSETLFLIFVQNQNIIILFRNCFHSLLENNSLEFC